MDTEIIRQVSTLQRSVDNLIRPENTPRVLDTFKTLPGAIGVWYSGSYQRSTGNIPNLLNVVSDTNRQDLTLNGTKTNIFDYTSTGIGYTDLNGTDNYLSTAGNTDLDTPGTEAYIVNPGMFVCGWFWFDATSPPAAVEYLIAKDTVTAGNRTFAIFRFTDGTINFVAYDSGNTGRTVALTPTTPNDNMWHFIAASIDITNTRQYIYYDSQSNSGASGADIKNSTAALTIGASAAPSRYLNGRFSIAAYGSNYLEPAIIKSTFQQTRSLYNA